MRKLFASALSVLIFHALAINSIFPCTTFCLKSETELLFGRNYDWHIEYGIIFVNKKDVLKSAATEHKSAAQWISKYGSVTFNQFGREFPTGGINETGLVVELMWLEGTEYPSEDKRPEVGGILQWIQYQLDNFSTVEEVIESDKLIRIPRRSVPVHFLITDSKGNSAVIEFLNGKLAAHSGNELKYSVLANDTYESSEEFYEQYLKSGDEIILYSENNSMNRFGKTCAMIDRIWHTGKQPSVEYAFDILNEVSQGESTKWSIVYDINNRKIFYKTNSNKAVRNIDMKSLDFGCSKPVMMIDISKGKNVNVNNMLKPYEYSANRKLIEDSYDNVDFLESIPEDERDITASYPEKLTCTGKSGSVIPDESGSNSKTGILIVSGVLAGISIAVLKRKYF